MPDITPTDLTQRAAAVGDELLSQAKELQDGSLTWGRGFGIDFGPVADSGLFNGRIGEALFLSALATSTRESRFADAALRIVEPLRVRLRSASEVTGLAAQIGLGISGIGSILYALVRMASFLDLPSLRADAAGAAESVSMDAVRAYPQFDIYWGAPGLIMGFLALMDSGVGVGGDLAVACANHLLQVRVHNSSSKLRVWPTTEGLPTAGFAHGQSGVAHSLLELHHRTPRTDYYNAAMEAFEFERSAFREDIGDWADFPGQVEFRLCSWCHGAPGIALARLSALTEVRDEDEPSIALDLRHALLRTISFQQDGSMDTICCGTLGRADSLLEAGLRLNNRSLIDAATAMVAYVMGETVRRPFRVSLSTEMHQSGGTWQGLAGIGYELLRFSDPGRFPSLLRLA